VAWYYHAGSYAERLAVPAASLVKVPDDVADETAAAVMMQGLTASHLTTETYAVKPGDTAVVHSAAGGVGLTLTQMIKARGGTVIGLVSREEKAAVAKEAGADHVRTREALVKRTGEIFDLIRAGRLTPRIGARYALADAASAHADIESRRTTGKLLLLP
jgi:NADPH:quinone reductase-like Zn-dependent oxidoreductase